MDQHVPNSSTHWTSTQAYVLAVICLLCGVLVGYLLRGPGPASAAPALAPQPQQTSQSAGNVAGSGQLGPEQLKAMADKQAEPVLRQLQLRPYDPGLLAQAGNIYFDAQQFKIAAEYYANALERDPQNTDVRTDMATAHWYLGDVDGALTEFDRVLQQHPNKANALLNRGIVRWQGKMDLTGAIADWESLLKANPNFPQRSDVEQMIAQAKKHATINPGEKTSKPAM